jgi:predicted DNA-binding protein
MSKTATVSFKVGAEEYTVLLALARGAGKSMSEFVRETVEGALGLERQVERLAVFFAEPAGEWGSEG